MSASRLASPVLLAVGSPLATLLVLELLLRAATLIAVVERKLFPVIIGWREADYATLFRYDDHLARYLLRPARGFRHVHDGDVVVTLIPPKEAFFLADDTAPWARRRDALAAAFRPHDVIVIDVLEAVPPSEILKLFFEIDIHFDRGRHEWFAQLLRRQLPLSDLASAVELDTPAGSAYRRRPLQESPRSSL